MRRRSLLAASLSLAAAPAAVRAQGRNGVALVIGNSKYQWEASLPNVRRDAPDVARRFEALGLKTETLLDADRASMLAALGRLKSAAQGARLAALYFAGHGVATDKGEALVPVDADLANPASISALVPKAAFYEAVSASGAKLLVFDNCRNNPADGWRQLEAERRAAINAGFGGEAAGLGAAGPNTMVLHSTAPGLVALDGPAGQNSPFALAFLRGLDQPSQDIQAMVQQMRRDLLLATEGRQILFSNSNFAGAFVLAPGGRAGAPPPMAMPSPARLIELPHAYAFARSQQYMLPAGLVAIRSTTPGLEGVAGSYQFVGKSGKFGSHPVLAIVLSASSEANVVFSRVGINGDRIWRFYKASVAGKSIKLYSSQAGISEYVMDWSRDGKPTVTQQGDRNSSIGINVIPLERLDG